MFNVSINIKKNVKKKRLLTDSAFGISFFFNDLVLFLGSILNIFPYSEEIMCADFIVFPEALLISAFVAFSSTILNTNIGGFIPLTYLPMF